MLQVTECRSDWERSPKWEYALSSAQMRGAECDAESNTCPEWLYQTETPDTGWGTAKKITKGQS